MATLSGCGSEPSEPTPPPVVTQSVTVAPTTVALTPAGATRQLVATVITSAGPATNPAVAWSSSNTTVATVSGTGATGTVTSVGAGTATITATSGGQSGSATVTVANSISTYTLTLGSGALTVVQDAPAIAIPVRLTRTNYTQPVQLALSGAPAGVTATIAPTTVTGDSATLNVTATGAAVPGNYPILVTATAPNLAGQTVTVTVTVQAAPVSANVTIDLRSCQTADGWFAFQNGANSPWTRVVSLNGQYPITATAAVVGVAYSAQGFTNVVYARPADISSTNARSLCITTDENRWLDGEDPPKSLVVNIVPAIPSDGDRFTYVSLAGFQPGPFSAGTIPIGSPLTGRHELIAVSQSPRDTAAPARAIVRRNVDVGPLPNGALLNPALDFSSAEAGRMVWTPMTVSGRGTSGILYYEPFVTLGGACFSTFLPREAGDPLSSGYGGRLFERLFSAADRMLDPKSVGPFSLRSLFFTRGENLVIGTEGASLPATMMRSGDLYGALYSWTPNSLTAGEYRSLIVTSNSELVNVPLPSVIPDVTPDILPDTAYRRFRFRYTLPVDLADAAVVRYQGSNRAILSVRMSAAVLGGRNVDITTPDFTGVSGWNNLFAPRGTVQFEVRGEQNTRTTPCTPGRTAVSSRFGIS